MNGSSRLAAGLLALLAVACGSDPAPDTRPRGPLPRSYNVDGSFRVDLQYHQGPPCGAGSSIAATGPGPDPMFDSTTVQLGCSGGTWSADVAFVSWHPDAPTEYAFAVTEGGATRNEVGTVPCYVDALPGPLEPSGAATVTSPVSFSWTIPGAFPGTAMEYAVYVFGTQPVVSSSVVNAGSLTLALPARGYEGWAVEMIPAGGWEPTSPLRCSGRDTRGSPFVVAP